MTAAAAEPSVARDDVLARLRGKVAAMERGTARQRVATLPIFDDVLPLHAGGVYGVDSAGLALALAAGASAAGEWVGFAGWSDFGAEAAAGLGVRLDRTVLVPEPGEHWLEVTAALVDVLRVVVLRPRGEVSARDAGRLESRLRTRSSVLVVWGAWPRVEARIGVEDAAWSGAGVGHGRLEERRSRLVVRRGTRPAERSELWWPSLEPAGPAGPAGVVEALA